MGNHLRLQSARVKTPRYIPHRGGQRRVARNDFQNNDENFAAWHGWGVCSIITRRRTPAFVFNVWQDG
jgi:hypothetical protein